MNNQRNFTNLLIAYAVIFTVFYFIVPRFFPQFMPGPQKPPSAVEIGQRNLSLRDQAAKAELEARTSDTRLSLSERAAKWDEALHAYEQIERAAGNTDAALDAKFQQARVHEERAGSDARNTGDYDQAERIYKDLERHHATDRAKITVNGQTTEVAVAQVAREKLDAVLRARDQRQRGDWRYRLLDFFVNLTGRIPGFSYWFALLLITLLIKAVLFPITKRQFKSMADMQRIAPRMKEIQEKLKGRPADEINRKIMALYKEEGVNPAAGCLPMFAQMLVLIPLYTMIRMYEYQFRHGYFLWIGSELSRQYPRFLATSLAVPDMVLLLLYCGSMFLTSRLQPPAADPQQAQQQKMMAYFMPVVFGYMTWLYAWPSAFTFYWLVLNSISTYQQWHILKVVGAHNPPAAPKNGRPPARGGSGSDGSNGHNGGRPVRSNGGRPSGARKSARR